APALSCARNPGDEIVGTPAMKTQLNFPQRSYKRERRASDLQTPRRPHASVRRGVCKPDALRIRRVRSSGGFTLVEIMMVVLIISVLATLSIPVLQRVQRKTKTAAIMNDFRVFAAAFDTYAHETGG